MAHTTGPKKKPAPFARQQLIEEGTMSSIRESGIGRFRKLRHDWPFTPHDSNRKFYYPVSHGGVEWRETVVDLLSAHQKPRCDCDSIKMATYTILW